MSEDEQGSTRVLLPNLAWIAGLIFLLMVVFKVLVVAHMNPVTATILISSADKATIALGTITSTMPYIASGLYIALLVMFDTLRVDDKDKLVLRSLIVVTAALTVAVSAWYSGIFYLLIGDFMLDGPFSRLTFRIWDRSEPNLKEAKLLMERAEQASQGSEAVNAEATQEMVDSIREKLAASKQNLDRIRARSVKVFWLAAAYWILSSSLFVFSDRPWLPAQRLVISGGKSFTGFIINENDTQAVVLRNRERSVQMLDKRSLQSKGFCEQGGSRERPLLSLAFRPVTYDRC